MEKYSIMTSAAEYVTSVGMSAITTGANVRQAKRMTKQDAQKALKMIKATIDSGAEIFENPEA